MYKIKLSILALACTMGVICSSPTTVIAAETTTESAIKEQKSAEQKGKKADVMKEAEEKWNALTNKQKQEVYSLIKDQIKAEIKVMSKLVKLGVISQENADEFKAHMMERFDQLIESGEFPFFKQKNHKGSK